MKVSFILLIFFQIYLVKSEDYNMHLYSIKEIDIMKKGKEYSFQLKYLRENQDLSLLIYLKDSSISNPFSFSYEFIDDYESNKKEDQLEAKTTTDKDHYIVYTSYTCEKKSHSYYSFTIKVQPNVDIENVLVVYINNSPFEFYTSNIIFFIFAGICALLCVITLIKTKACGNKNKSISNSQLPNSPIQPQIQISQTSQQDQPLL